jgi:PAS domain S-box-containing protein
MFKRINIGGKITLLVISLVLLTIVAVGYITTDLVKRSVEEDQLQRLSIANKSAARHIELFFERQSRNVELASEVLLKKRTVELITEYNAVGSDSLISTLDRELRAELTYFGKSNNFHSVTITTLNGDVIVSTDPEASAQSTYRKIDREAIGRMHDSLYIGDIKPGENTALMIAGKGLKNSSGETVAILMGEMDLMPLMSELKNYEKLGETGETYLGKQYDEYAVYISPLRFDKEAAFLRNVGMNSQRGYALQQAVKGKEGSVKTTDYRNQEVLATWTHIPSAGWGVVTKIDTAEISGFIKDSYYKFFVVAGIMIFLALLVSTIFSRFLIAPIISLKETLNLLRQGILPKSVEQQSNDEIGDMAVLVDRFVQGLKQTASFAHQIGQGAFDADYEPLSKEDTLGNSLINMRNSIQESEKRDDERNWIVTGVAEIGEILREHDTVQGLGDAVVAYVTDKIGAVQGALFVVNDEKDKPYLEMKASYAYNKKKHLQATFKFAEGLVGQAAIEQDTLLRTEIPYDYVSITSGLLGDQRPSCLLVVPLITDEKVYGVMEFAGFEKFSERYVKFVQEISLIIARTVFNIKVNERTRNLLSESQKMSGELQEKQEILQQNAEEMAATQEELKRTNNQLEEQIAEVERTQNRMASLLENASEVITIYEENEEVRYISPSVERILGYKQDDMIGHTDASNIVGEGRALFDDMFKQLLDNPKESLTIQYEYKRKDGDTIWLEATGTNLLADRAVEGIIVNSRDITERRRAEQEERMRSKMQALSENSPDLITRIDNEGTFFYINPVIETYAEKKPDHFLQKKIEEVELNEGVTEKWLSILNEVRDTSEKVSLEMPFPSPQLGERIMQVNAIPEFDDVLDLESILLVSHDITESKLAELEIKNKNKKINDSINYAKRIQGAILPNNELISQVFRESFIFYKARDVVSGDFPWFLQRGDDIYIAAVDCTGHGVPGALISLIGYFLLNDIVRSRKIEEPGAILDQLDEGVTSTLKQDSDDSKSKDGMDIALCRINVNQRFVQYAGAHRPLYAMMGGEMNEIKGDKFPIGGGIYKNQTDFTTTELKMAEGDSIYFCSDGFPDQFGGPEDRKFGPKRLRKIIVDNYQKPMDEVHKEFAQQWESWRGEQTQTDDVLMIGIKF